MKYTFKLRGKDVTIAAMDPLVALQPAQDLRGVLDPDKLIERFGAAPEDDTRGGMGILVLPARNRKLFEEAGWLFVEGSEAVVKAATTRTLVEGAQIIRRVYL